ncbi:hypothetical protein FQR65_LT16774 [Abscondita terminalis]|nr:hypothetical protein FQR65_LT16774 [Abscondita terminalis]
MFVKIIVAGSSKAVGFVREQGYEQEWMPKIVPRLPPAMVENSARSRKKVGAEDRSSVLAGRSSVLTYAKAIYQIKGLDELRRTTYTKLTQRSGTNDLGKIYESKVAALLALRCVENPKIKNAWVASNINEAYDFDDVVLYVKDDREVRTAYLMQLKHQNEPKTIRRKEFLYDASAKKKSNMSEDFSLFKHYKSYVNIRERLERGGGGDEDGLINSLRNADEIVYVFFTNRAVAAEFDFLRVGKVDNLLDTYKGGGNVYGFDSKALGLDDRFVENLKLITKQAHVAELDDLIKFELKRVIQDHVDVNASLERYLSFAHSCVKGGGGNSSFDALTKNDVVGHLTTLILADYQVKFSFNSLNRAEFSVWDEMIGDSGLVVVESSEGAREFLKSYASAKIAAYHRLDHWNQELSKNSFYKACDDLRPVLDENGRRAGVDRVESVRSALDFRRIRSALRLSRNRVIVLADATVTNCFTDLTHFARKHRDSILDYPITVQGRPGSRLRDVVNKPMYKLIRCKEIIEVISDRFNVGKPAGSSVQFYVPRLLSRILFAPQALKQIDSKFLIRGIDRRTYGNRLSKSSIVFESDPASHIADYHELRYVNWEPDDTVFSGGRSNLWSTDANFMWTSVDELYEQRSACVINGNPGMGKTELLNHVASNAPTRFWVIKVNLNEHNDYYKTLKDADKQASDHLMYFYVRAGILSERVFLKYVEEKAVLVLLDGFDEISMTYKDEATSIATSLHSSGFKVWVTTRPVTQAHLEDALDTISRTLKPLPDDDQKRLLIDYFSRFGDDAELQTITEFVDKLLTAAAANLNVSDRSFTEMPLQTKLLADVFENDLRRILQTKIFDFNTNFDIIFLYESFLEAKMDIFCKKFGDIYRDMRQFFEKVQQLYALQVIFPEHMLEKLGVGKKLKLYYEDDDRMVHFLQRKGVVAIYQRDTGGEEKLNVGFVHRTFAEFLAAKWLYQNFETEEVRALIKKCRFEDSIEFLFNVFDRYLAKDFPLHLSVIDRNKGEIVRLMDPMSVDRGGRTVFHLLSCYGLKHTPYNSFDILDRTIVDELADVFDSISPQDFHDSVDELGFNAFEYSIYSNTYAIADKLCAAFDHFSFSMSLKRRDDLYHFCARCDYPHLFLRLFKYFARKELLQGFVKPQKCVAQYCKMSLVKYVSRYKWDSVLSFVRETVGEDDVGFAAAFASDAELLRLIDGGVDVNKPDADLYTPLHYASAHNRLDNAKVLVSRGARINNPGHNGNTALHLATNRKSHDVAHFLIEEGADANLTNDFERTPFHNACAYGNTNLLKQILPKVIDINRKAKGENALCLAIQQRNYDVAHALIDVGIDVSDAKVLNYASKSGKIDLVKKLKPITEVTRARTFEIVYTIMDETGNADFENRSKTNEFPRACKFGYLDTVKEILPTITDLNLQNKKGKTALHISVENKHIDVAHALVVEGADVNIVDVLGSSPFMLMCKHADLDFIEKLLPSVANVNLQNLKGKSALHFAISNKKFDVAHALIDEGADVNLPDHLGTTPLLCACKFTDYDLVERITLKVTDINCCNNSGQSALHVLVSNKYDCDSKYFLENKLDMTRLLLKSGVDVNTKDRCGNTALHLICDVDNYVGNEPKGFSKTVALVLLQEPKVESNLKNSIGRRPIDLARDNPAMDEEFLSVLNSKIC